MHNFRSCTVYQAVGGQPVADESTMQDITGNQLMMTSRITQQRSYSLV